MGELQQVDTYFLTLHGRFKLRETEGREAELIWYDRPDLAEARDSVYHVLRVPQAAEMKDALARALGVRRVVRKRRRLWMWENVRIHLDAVEFWIQHGAANRNQGESAQVEVREVHLPFHEMLEDYGSDATGADDVDESPGGHARFVPIELIHAIAKLCGNARDVAVEFFSMSRPHSASTRTHGRPHRPHHDGDDDGV